jgi:uncharacterized membrane protein YfcA
MDYLILTLIGLVMGLLGGLLGIGGSVVMIPAMTVAFGENQHLYQASAMICNFFVAVSSLAAHRRAQVLEPVTLRWMIPAGIVGIVLGVTVSNLPLFAKERSYLLARTFGGFLAYVALYNTYRLYQGFRMRHMDPTDLVVTRPHSPLAGLIGLITGLSAGLLGIGAGTVATPLQQLFLKTSLRRAMAHSAVLITSMAWLGAIYKNVTLARHHVVFPLFPKYPGWAAALIIAWTLIPTALVGGYVGAHLMHRLPKDLIRVVFVGVVAVAALRLLSVSS